MTRYQPIIMHGKGLERGARFVLGAQFAQRRFGARRIDVLRALTLAPTYMSHQSWLVVARDLYPERLPGDEPEELEVVPWKLQDLDQLMLREDFSEGRSLAALFIAREWLNART